MDIKRTLSATFLICLISGPAVCETLVSDKFVAVMRHGVRPQTSSKELARMSAKQWPVWNTPDGALTPHGATAAAQLAKWEHGMLAAKGLVPETGCPAKESVFSWGNSTVQRTIDTGNVILSTMFPGCDLTVGHASGDGPDPLYDASETALGAIDTDTAQAAILEAAGGSFDAAKQKAAPLMREMDAILGCDAAGSDCSLQNRPWSIEVKKAKGDKPASVSLKGPLAEAGTLAQVFLLQYANGFPADEVAFGKASAAADIIRLSQLRQIKYDLSNRVPYIAQRDGSNFLNQLLLALDKNAPAGGPPDAKFLLFMGSDTQQAELATLLGIHWKIPPYLDDETPPTGALTFERLHDADGKPYVRMGFVAPSLDQIRNASVIDDKSPPLQAAVDMPGCEGEAKDGACPLDRFLTLAKVKIDKSAVAPYVYH
ncbi:histidine-type phosphatase [Rhizobium skierniewicense]|uniref:histidine-type phosphatase n=1 Tax=Rhizobium skierniewicense TaxID=984260 RepID=UPI001573053D|nr:histidine-type phosphatase [Rhizobium skierniewicense]NTF30825.1 histidine-type phosphatase [Rhizobium skierniewicense]